MIETAETVRRFWLEEVGPEGWYGGGEDLDARIRERFRATWDCAAEGGLLHWTVTGPGTLAYLIVTDQFPRNMFRDDPRAFSTDRRALAAAKRALVAGADLHVEGDARQFFYLPLEHSESTPDQHRAVRLIHARMDAPETLLHARAHRRVIRAHGRFPHRNEALGRDSSGAEREMLDRGGYAAVVREMRDAPEKAAA